MDKTSEEILSIINHEISLYPKNHAIRMIGELNVVPNPSNKLSFPPDWNYLVSGIINDDTSKKRYFMAKLAHAGAFVNDIEYRREWLNEVFEGLVLSN